MTVAPIEITHKTFARKIYGLDSEEVYDFLRHVADEFEALCREHEQLGEKLKTCELSLQEHKNREDTLKQTLQVAAQMSDRLKAEAQREGELIIREARQRGEIIVKEARESLRSLYREINDLKKTRIQFETGLKSLVKAHMAMLDQGHSVVPDPELQTGLEPAPNPTPAPFIDPPHLEV